MFYEKAEKEELSDSQFDATHIGIIGAHFADPAVTFDAILDGLALRAS